MSQPDSVPESAGGARVHGNYLPDAVYEGEPGPSQTAYSGPGDAGFNYDAWVDAKASAKEITQGAGANGV